MEWIERHLGIPPSTRRPPRGPLDPIPMAISCVAHCVDVCDVYFSPVLHLVSAVFICVGCSVSNSIFCHSTHQVNCLIELIIRRININYYSRNQTIDFSHSHLGNIFWSTKLSIVTRCLRAYVSNYLFWSWDHCWGQVVLIVNSSGTHQSQLETLYFLCPCCVVLW